jgi:8-amino-7-oxononanoate synthase
VNDTLTAFAADKLKALEAKSLRRTLRPTHRLDGVWVERDGRRLVSFSCNDYLGLSHHPAVKAAAVRAIELYGVGSGASRLVTGDHPLFSELEARLAQLKGTQAACVFGSGYLANRHHPDLRGPGRPRPGGELAHACIWAGAKLSGAQTLSFRHNDMADLAAKLGERRPGVRRALVATSRPWT